MAEPTVTVVIKRIRSIVDEETEILGPVKDKFAELLSKTENLTSYLNCADENTLLTETATKYENATDQFIYKVTSESRGSCSFLRRFLVEIAHESEDIIDNIIYKIAYERSRRCGSLKKYVCKPCFQIDPQHIQKIEGIIKRLDQAKDDIEPYVTVVIRHIRSILDEETEILGPVKDKFNELLSKAENLTSYLDNADENTLLTEIANKYEDATDQFIYEMTSESRRRFDVLRRFLVEIAHESEEIIDDIIHKIAYERSGRCSFLKKYVCKPCFQIETQHIQKIEGIIKRLDKAKEDIEPYVLEPKKEPTDQRLRSWDKTEKLPPTNSYPHKLVGLTKDISSLVEKIIQKGNTMSVLYIVGTGGSGKTTLATELNNHPEIKEHFKSVVWASASEKKDAKNIFLEILRKTQGKDEDVNSSTITENLVNKICNILEERPYLIILDDVEDPDNLATHLFPMFQRLSYKSKIIITTRATPSNPYKQKEFTVNSDENVNSLAEKLTMKKTHESSIFHMPAKQATVLLLDSLYMEDARLKEHFDSRKWVNIEDDWDNSHILLNILQEVTTGTIPSKEKVMTDINNRKESPNVDELVTRIEEFLAKKALIVLHQVQNAEDLVHLLHPILEKTNHKSKVIFVTDNLPTELQQNEEYITGEDLLDADHLVGKLTGEGEQPYLFSIRDLDSSGCNKDLARVLYNHPIVKQHFEDENRFWITIPRGSDAESGMRHIIKNITGNNPSIQGSSTKKLANVLLSALEEKKYLLVLNDMGDAEDLVFDLVAAQSSTKTHKKERSLQSKIIITTGNPRIIRHSNLKCFLYEMQPLPENESWDLLCSIAFNHARSRPSIGQIIGQFNRKSNREMIRKIEMLQNCKGIPLAIVVLGGLLSTKETVEEWEVVSTSFGSEATLSNKALENILLISYRDLPSDVMPCFVYFGLFPQHSEIPTGMLIRMWLSEGLVTLDPPSGTRQTLENVAAQYLEELACRKFNKYPTESPKLRTLVQFGKHGLSAKHYYFQQDALPLDLEPIHEHFKLLRVLILSGTRIRALPEQVGELMFLTYLGLRATNVQALPESIGNLQKLLTLDYRGSLKPSICEPLPNVLWKMTRLRHVYLPEFAILSMKKLDLSTLQNLQVLWGVSGGDWLMDDLGKLSVHLVKLGIVNISCNEELDTVVKWLNLEPKKLQVLKLDWHRARQDKLLFPENLNFQHLHKLAFIGRLKEEYNFTLLPSLVKLELYFSHLTKYDPTEKLGRLPKLEVLHLWNSYRGIQWICGSNMFPKLKELQISHLPNLEEWRVEAGAMPHLKRLSIFSCRKLLGLPKGLRNINLQELEILDMPKSFCRRLQEIKDENTTVAEDIEIIQNIPYIKVEAC
ncbi:hypothetical protein SOVF_181910 [Spinacia oleracea]|nr:hypothetical protein SOVF_181910 [Spinacia oleracea]